MSAPVGRRLILRASAIVAQSGLVADIEIIRPDGTRQSAGVSVTAPTTGAWTAAETTIPDGVIAWARIACNSGPFGCGGVIARLSIVDQIWDTRGEGMPLVESYLGKGLTAFWSPGGVSRYTESDVVPVTVATGLSPGATPSSYSIPWLYAAQLTGAAVSVVTSAVVANRGILLSTGMSGYYHYCADTGQIIPASQMPSFTFARGMGNRLINLFTGYGALSDVPMAQGGIMSATLDNGQAGDTIVLQSLTARIRPQPVAAF